MTTADPSTVPAIPHGTVPDIRLCTGTSLPGTDVLVIPVILGASGPELPVADRLGEETQISLWKTAVDAGVTGREGRTWLLPAQDGLPAPRILAVGLGPVDDLSPETVRRAAGNASRELALLGEALSALSLLGDLTGLREAAPSERAVISAAVEGHALGGYRYSGARSTPPSGEVSAVTVVAPERDETPEVFSRACAVAEAVVCARDLVNAPAGVLFPESYAAVISDLAVRSGVEVEVLTEEELAAQGFGGIMGVGRGSARPPRLVRLHYRPENGPTRHVALIGKGVTFDTGGLSLKRPDRMADMISDMGGSAAVVATVLAAAELDLPVEVTATLPLAENMPDGDAVRPGDLLRHYDGTTSEILNTDAEGRLILADAIARAVEDSPDLLIEASTLTGAQVRSLGDRITAVMGTPTLRDRIVRLAGSTGESAWPMPLPAEVADDIRSDVADLRNTGTVRWGGMAAAGHYLRHFVPDDLPWAHLDIAGPAYNTGTAHGYTPTRGTGAPVRTLIALLDDVAVHG